MDAVPTKNSGSPDTVLWPKQQLNIRPCPFASDLPLALDASQSHRRLSHREEMVHVCVFLVPAFRFTVSGVGQPDANPNKGTLFAIPNVKSLHTGLLVVHAVY